MSDVERVCIVVYKHLQGAPRYAILKRVKNWEGWELPKGHIEDGQSPEEAAYTELSEEAGIDETDIEHMEQIEYTFGWTYEEDGEEIHTECTCFIAEVGTDTYIDVSQNPDEEHDKGHFLNFRDARDILTYDDQRDLLKHVHDSLA